MIDESTVARVLSGEAPAEELERDGVAGGAPVADFCVEPEMLLHLVDARERGAIAPETLQGAAKLLLDSDNFGWADDDPIYTILHEWSRLEIDLAQARRDLDPRPIRDLPYTLKEEVGELSPGFRVALGVSAGIALICLGLMFLGGEARHLMAIGAGFFGIVFVLIYVMRR